MNKIGSWRGSRNHLKFNSSNSNSIHDGNSNNIGKRDSNINNNRRSNKILSFPFPLSPWFPEQ